MSERIEVELDTLSEIVAAAVRDALELAHDYDEPMTREEAAAYLKVHPQTLYDWAKDGLIRFSKLGDGERAPMRFFREDLNHFAKDRRRVETKPAGRARANPRRVSGPR